MTLPLYPSTYVTDLGVDSVLRTGVAEDEERDEGDSHQGQEQNQVAAIPSETGKAIR